MGSEFSNVSEFLTKIYAMQWEEMYVANKTAFETPYIHGLVRSSTPSPLSPGQALAVGAAAVLTSPEQAPRRRFLRAALAGLFGGFGA